MLHLSQRIYNLIDDIRNDNSDKIYLLVAHNGISRIVESYFRNMSNDEFSGFGIKNCELKSMNLKIKMLRKCVEGVCKGVTIYGL